MAEIAPNMRSFGNGHPSPVLDGKCPGQGGRGQHCSKTGSAVAGPAGLPEREVFMTTHPGLTVYVVNPMRTVEGKGQSGSMARVAFYDNAVMSLNRPCGQIVIQFPGRPDRMGASVARLTHYTVMPHAVPVEGRIGLFRKTLVGSDNEGGHIRAVRVRAPAHNLVTKIAKRIPRVARLTLGQIPPGLSSRLPDRRKISVAVQTNQTCGGHGPPGALGVLSWMTIEADISAGRRCRDPGGMITVDGSGHVLSRHLRAYRPLLVQIQRV